MRRTKNWDWNDEPDRNGNHSWDQAKISVLMDIRDELRALNMRLSCHAFLDIPSKLERIARQTKRRRKIPLIGKPKLRVVSRS